MEQIRQEVIRHLPHHGEIRRLFHGRGQCFPGLEDVIIDAYSPLLMIYLFQPREQEWLFRLVQQLQQCCDVPFEAVVVQRRYLPQTPIELFAASVPPPIEAVEAGLRYQLRLTRTQNIGFFPDMAVGRQLVRQRCAGKKILNLFAYSCSFSVAALAGGAKQVVNLDMSRSALELGRINHQLNKLDLRSVSFLAMELFRSQSKLRKLGPFDMVICDPPASQGKSFNAQHHWPKLLQRLPQWLAPGGELLLCVNGPHLPDNFMAELISVYLPDARELGRYSPGDDFPEKDPRCATTIHHLQLP
ncbi:MAG: class I SAM-dependent methyltransferase [Desulfuromonas sp.]|nr:class I SAM-dependent methyltransferase [Desulfuromonas sp.]